MSDAPSESGPSHIGTVVFDLDGVVYLGSTPIAGAGDTINTLVASGWQILYATNNSSKTPAAVAATLRERAGVDVDESTVVTSGMAATALLVSRSIRSALVLGSHELAETVENGGVRIEDHTEAEAVVVGLDRMLTYDKLDQAARAVRRGAAFVATNTDATFPTADGLSPGAGTIVEAVATASGRTYVACGKPNQPMADLVSRLVVTDNVWMIGDRPETDIAFAKRSGWTSVLTLTGVIDDIESVPVEYKPDHVVPSIRDLPSLLADANRAVPSRQYSSSQTNRHTKR